MTTRTQTLAEFLLARIAEDEEKAQTADEAGWTPTMPPPIVWTDHFARHMPTRVLAECEAKRRIVEIAEQMDREENMLGSYAHSILCRLATPYADHDVFREEWRA